MRKAAEAELDILNQFSPAAYRHVHVWPLLQRFMKRKPNLDLLQRIPADDATRAAHHLRLMRKRVFLHTAFLEAQGESPLHTASFWTAFADAALVVADRVAYHELTGKFGRPLDSDGKEVGRLLLGMGKLGSWELNPSSDIDIIFAYETDDGAASDLSLNEFFGRLLRRMRDLLGDVDENGFVFRVDLDLRPEGTTGTLVNSLDALEDYYERFGVTWERAALLRMRPIIDSHGIWPNLKARLRPFVFPRSSTLETLEDLADMRTKVASSAGENGFDVKRSRGGIRDVEFMVQVLQLLYGGRIKELRFDSIVKLLPLLEKNGLLDARTAHQLMESYVFLRRVEHCLQYREDQQTQFLPDEGPIREHVSRHLVPDASTPEESARRFEELLKDHRSAVVTIVDGFLEPSKEEESDWVRVALERKYSSERRCEALHQLGFHDSQKALQCIHLLGKTRGSPFTPRQWSAHGWTRRLSFRLLRQAAESPASITALARLPSLFHGAGHQLLLEELYGRPQLSQLLIRVLSLSAILSRHLSQQENLELFLFLGSQEAMVSRRTLVKELRKRDSVDEEENLVEMRWAQGRALVPCGMAFLDGRISQTVVGHQLSSLADALLERAHDIAFRKVSQRFGQPINGQFAICAMGRLGGRELGFASDLDVIFFYDGDGETQGPRPVSIREWAVRLAQQIIWVLGAALPQGSCYQVDSRLRPSGNQGPLCVKLDAFQGYHQRQGALWERQSLLRLRPVVGPAKLSREIVETAKAAAFQSVPKSLGESLRGMRDRMDRERGAFHRTTDLKLSPGGIADIEFVVQGLQLKYGVEDQGLWCTSTRRALNRLQKRGILAEGHAAVLRGHYDRFSAIRESLALMEDSRSAAIVENDKRLRILEEFEIFRMKNHAEGGLFGRLQREMVEVHRLAREIWSQLDQGP